MEGRLQVVEAVAANLQMEHDDCCLGQCLIVKLDLRQLSVCVYKNIRDQTGSCVQEHVRSTIVYVCVYRNIKYKIKLDLMYRSREIKLDLRQLSMCAYRDDEYAASKDATQYAMYYMYIIYDSQNPCNK